MDFVEEVGVFKCLDDDVFGGVELPPPKYNFSLEEAVLPCLFLVLACSSRTEPIVDELHLDLRTLSSLFIPGYSPGEGDDGKTNGEIVGSVRWFWVCEGKVAALTGVRGNSLAAALGVYGGFGSLKPRSESPSLSKLFVMSNSRSRGVAGIEKGNGSW